MFHGLRNKNVTEKNWIVNSKTAEINIFLLSLSLCRSLQHPSSRLWFTINNQDRSINGWTAPTAAEKKHFARWNELVRKCKKRRRNMTRGEMLNVLLQIAELRSWAINNLYHPFRYFVNLKWNLFVVIGRHIKMLCRRRCCFPRRFFILVASTNFQSLARADTWNNNILVSTK